MCIGSTLAATAHVVTTPSTFYEPPPYGGSNGDGHDSGTDNIHLTTASPTPIPSFTPISPIEPISFLPPVVIPPQITNQNGGSISSSSSALNIDAPGTTNTNGNVDSLTGS